MDRVIIFLLTGLGLGLPTQCLSADVVAYLKLSPVQIYSDSDLTTKEKPTSVMFGQGIKILTQTETAIKVILPNDETGWIKKSDAIISAMIGTVTDGQGFNLENRPKMMLWNNPSKLDEFLSSKTPNQFPPDWVEVPSVDQNNDFTFPLIASDHKTTKEGKSIELAEVLIPFTPSKLHRLDLERRKTGQNYAIAFLVDRSPDAIESSEKLLLDLSNKLERLLANEKNNFKISLSYFGAGEAFQLHSNHGLDGMRKKLVRKAEIDMKQGEPLEYALQSELAAADPAVSATTIIVLSGANLDSGSTQKLDDDESRTENTNEKEPSTTSVIMAQSTPEPGSDLLEFARSSGAKINIEFLDYSENLSLQIADVLEKKIKPRNSEAIDLPTLQKICKTGGQDRFPCFLPTDTQLSLTNQISNFEWVAQPSWVVIDGLIVTSKLLPISSQSEAIAVPDTEQMLLSEALKTVSKLQIEVISNQEKARLTELELLASKKEALDITSENTAINDKLILSIKKSESLQIKAIELSKSVKTLESALKTAKDQYKMQTEQLIESDRALREEKIIADQNLNLLINQNQIELERRALEFSTSKANLLAQIDSLNFENTKNSEQLKDVRNKAAALAATVTKISNDRDSLLNSLSSAESILLRQREALHAASNKQQATDQQIRQLELSIAEVSEKNTSISSELMRSRKASKIADADNFKLQAKLNSSYDEMKSVKTELTLLEDQFASITEKANEYSTSLDASIKGMAAYREATTLEKSKSTAAIENLQRELAISKNLLQENLAQSGANFSKILAASELEKENLSKSISHLSSENTHLLNEVSQKNKLLTESASENSTINQDKIAVIEQLNQTNAKLQATETDLALQTASSAKLRDDLQRAQGQIELLSQKLKSSRQEVEDLKLDLFKASSKEKISKDAPSQKPISNNSTSKTKVSPESGSTTGFFGGGG